MNQPLKKQIEKLVSKRTKVKEFYQPMLDWFWDKMLKILGSSAQKNQQLAVTDLGH